jgi:hypothetical protein
LQTNTRYDPNRVFEMNDGRLYYAVESTLIHAKDGYATPILYEQGKVKPETTAKLVHFGNAWEPDEIYQKGKLTKRQKRMFMRLNSGLSCGIAKKERLIFMTLTTQYDLTAPEQKGRFMLGLNKAFTILKKRIERYLQRRIYIKYCKKHHYTPFKTGWRSKEIITYPNIWKKCIFKMKYFKVKTKEGGGVLHVVFRKGYDVPKLPQQWVSKQWQEIWHGSWNVDMRQIEYSDAVKTSFYIIRGYVQNQPVIRMSYGQQWVYQGFKRSFIHLIEVYRYRRALEIWKKNMENDITPTKASTYQTKLRYRQAQNRTYNKRYFELTDYAPKKLIIADSSLITKYPKKCYEWLEDESTGELTIKGRLIRLPKGKICLSRPLIPKKTVQTYFEKQN